MVVNLQIEPAYRSQIANAELLKQALQSTVQRFPDVVAATCTLVISDDRTIRQLNRQYRGIDAPTDVLSFANTPDPDFPGLDQGHLGDLIIAYPLAQRQALAAGHSPEEELVLLTVHGMLHLLGLDHDTLPKKQEMWATQNEIMTGLGLAHIQPIEN